MKILLIGKGHLGSFLKERLSISDEMHWVREMAELDATTIVRLAPEVVVNTAGKTDLSWCEANPVECFRCNVSAPLGVYRAIKEVLFSYGRPIPYVHLSSGCVWDGPYNSHGKPFGWADPPTPACFYSWTKAACDAMLLQERSTPISILRPRQVYSHLDSPRNTLAKLNRYPKLLDTPNSMTSAATIARTIEKLFETHPGLGTNLFWNRVMNVYDRGHSSPFEVGTMLAEAGKRQPPERLTKGELDGWHKPKRVDAVIEDGHFEHLVDPPGVQHELRRVIGTWGGK